MLVKSIHRSRDHTCGRGSPIKRLYLRGERNHVKLLETGYCDTSVSAATVSSLPMARAANEVFERACAVGLSVEHRGNGGETLLGRVIRSSR